MAIPDKGKQRDKRQCGRIYPQPHRNARIFAFYLILTEIRSRTEKANSGQIWGHSANCHRRAAMSINVNKWATTRARARTREDANQNANKTEQKQTTRAHTHAREAGKKQWQKVTRGYTTRAREREY